MSEYTTIALEFNDGQTLRESLDEMGAGYQIDLKQPMTFGHAWHGKAKPQANVVIQKLNKNKVDVLSSYRQFGFLKLSNGSYGVIADGPVPHDFMQQLKQTYAKHMVIKQARKMGFTLASQKTSDGKIKLKMTRISG